MNQFDSKLIVSLTRNWESIWLEIKSQFDLKLRINFTPISTNYSESRVEFYFLQWLNFLGQNDYILSFNEEQISLESLSGIAGNFVSDLTLYGSTKGIIIGKQN